MHNQSRSKPYITSSLLLALVMLAILPVNAQGNSGDPAPTAGGPQTSPQTGNTPSRRRPLRPRKRLRQAIISRLKGHKSKAATGATADQH